MISILMICLLFLPNGPVVYSVYRDYRYNRTNRIPSEDVEVDDKIS